MSGIVFELFVLIFQVSQLISRFLASPRRQANLTASATNTIPRSRKKEKLGMRLSNSSPALLDSNLNSLADAFANRNDKENGDINIQDRLDSDRR